MSPLLDLQRRMAECGRIRIGKRDGNRPTKLETFRVTSASKDIIQSVADVYGGEPKQWKPGPKEPAQWECITEADTLEIVVTPGQTLSQHYEQWSAGGCVRRCDGVTEQISDQPCLCGDPKECKPTSRLSIMLPQVEALGLFRLETKGYFAAVELAGTVELLEYATQRGTFLPAKLRLDQRVTRKEGKTNRFAVPVIEIHQRVGAVLESIGALDSNLELPAATVASSSRAALPSAPKGRQPKPQLPDDSPPLPDDPTFSFSSSTGPSFEDGKVTPIAAPDPNPVVPFDQQRASKIKVAAKNSNALDMLDELVSHVTDGQTTNPGEVDDNQAATLYDYLFRLKRGLLVASYDENGRLRLVEQGGR